MSIEVVLFGEALRVTLMRQSRLLWIAVGEYMGQTIAVHGTGPSSAAAHWREAARWKAA